MRTVLALRPFLYSHDGVTPLQAQPGDLIDVRDENVESMVMAEMIDDNVQVVEDEEEELEEKMETDKPDNKMETPKTAVKAPAAKRK